MFWLEDNRPSMIIKDEKSQKFFFYTPDKSGSGKELLSTHKCEPVSL